MKLTAFLFLVFLQQTTMTSPSPKGETNKQTCFSCNRTSTDKKTTVFFSNRLLTKKSHFPRLPKQPLTNDQTKQTPPAITRRKNPSLLLWAFTKITLPFSSPQTIKKNFQSTTKTNNQNSPQPKTVSKSFSKQKASKSLSLSREHHEVFP